MSNIKKTKTILTSIVVGFFLTGNAFALSEVTTIESRVNSHSGNTGSTIYMVTGPENIQYRLEASPGEVERIQTFVQTNPDAIVRFSGSVNHLDGTNVFRVNKWEETTKTTKTTSTDSLGNTKVMEKTETHKAP